MKKKTRRSQSPKKLVRLLAKKRSTPIEACRRAARTGRNHTEDTWKPAQVWMVYKNPPNPTVFKSGDFVAVEKRRGRIPYEGSAGDKG